MAKKLLLLITFSMLLFSCSTYNSMKNADKNIRNISIGMSQQQIVSIMGDQYEVVEAKDNVIVWGYKAFDEGIYKLRFVDGKLLGWNKVWLNKYEFENRPAPASSSDTSK